MKIIAHSRLRLLLACCLIFAGWGHPVAAQTPPETFTRTLVSGAQSLLVEFRRHPVRSANFRVQVQQADGSFLDHAAEAERTYLGRVPSRPGAVAAGLLRADNTLLVQVSLEDGTTWHSSGGEAYINGSTFIPAWPTTVVMAGGAGPGVYAAQVGFDSTYEHFQACGGTPAGVLERCEFSLACVNMIYLRDVGILHKLGRVIVRAAPLQNPYSPDGGDSGALLTRVKDLWNAGVPMGGAHQVAAVIHPSMNGGLGYIGAIGQSIRYSSNDSDSSGDFSLVWRHELGHNWGCDHNEGGGNPEGSSILSGNGLSRFSSSENLRMISHRNSRLAVLESLGHYPFPLPPRANQDVTSYLQGSEVLIDVLANDSDSNGESLTLLSFDSVSALGCTLTRSAGTGSGGRDEVRYTPKSQVYAEDDWFKYRVRDAGGQEAVGYAMVRARKVADSLVDHWKLDESTGTTAVNTTRPSRNGLHENGPVIHQPGANAVTRKGVFYDGINDRTVIPSQGYYSNALTFTVWVQRQGQQKENCGILFTRLGINTSGLHFGTANELRYTWNAGSYTWAPSPALTVPDNTWCLAALSVSPSGAVLHLRTPDGMQTAAHNVSLANSPFNGYFYLAHDAFNSQQYFRGRLDDVRVYYETLTTEDIESLYQQAIDPPMITLVQPASGSVVNALDLAVTATAETQAERVERMDFLTETGESVSAERWPWEGVFPWVESGAREIHAAATYGDWGYVVDSVPVPITVQPPPPPVVRVQASLPASKRGPVAGQITFVRDHAVGALTVPFTVSGTAVAGLDYLALGVSSVTFPPGSLAVSVPVLPIAAAPDGLFETLTLTAGAGAGWTLGTPAAATLILDDHITSVATGAWNTAPTWNSNAAAPIAGTQNTGPGYAVAAGHVVTSNNTGSTNQALVAGSLRIKSGGVLDLAMLHLSALTTAQYNLPATFVEDGGTLQFRASVGSSGHTVAAPLDFSGTTHIRISGGSFSNNALLSGPVSGNGVISVITQSSGLQNPGVRALTLSGSNNSYAGGWVLSHTGNGADFGGLKASASRALGTGQVTVGARSQLINDHAAGLDSLGGVLLDGDASSLILNQPWNNPQASLTLEHGNALVQLGNAASSIGSIKGSGGTLQGTGATSALTVNQTRDAWFGGTLGNSLTFEKSGPAVLDFDGTVQAGLRLKLAQGTLVYGAPAAVIASLTQSGGVLEMNLPSQEVVPLTVSGNYRRTGGVLRFKLPAEGPVKGTPYTLLAWQGTRSGQPVVEFSPPHAAVLDYGSGTNSQLRVTFSASALLTVSASPPAGGSVTGGGTFTDGSTQPVTATAAAGWQFKEWSGSGVADSSSASTTVTLNGPQTLTAHFLSPYEIWATAFNLTGPAAAPDADPDGDGLVNGHEWAFDFDPGDPASSLTLEPHRLPDGQLRLVINKVISAGTFTLHWTTTLAPAWEGSMPVPVTVAATNFTLTPPVPGAGTRCFYRLVYTAPLP